MAFLIGHPDEPFFPGGHQPDDRRLNDGHQRHVAVGRHHDGSQIFRAQHVCHKDGRGAVRRANHGDGSGIVQLKDEACREQGEKDAELGRRPKEHEPGLFQQGAEIDHGTNADEEQQRKQLVAHSHTEQLRDGPHGLPLGNGPGERQVDEDGAKAHGQQQAWLHLFCDGQINEQTAHRPHDHHLPGQISKIGKQAGECCEKLHFVSSQKQAPEAADRKQKKETPATAKNHCDKSLKRTHDIGCFHRADAAMQCTAPGPRHTPYSLLSVLLYAMSRRSVNGLRRFFCRFFSGEFLSNAPHCPLSGSVPAPGQPPGCGSIPASWLGRGLSGTPNRRSAGTGGRWRR